MKIEHFQVDDVGSSRAVRAVAKVIEGLRGVAGVVAVRSMGLLTVLYDERRTDPVTISDEILRAAAADVRDDPSPVEARPRRSSTPGRRVAPSRFDTASTIR